VVEDVFRGFLRMRFFAFIPLLIVIIGLIAFRALT
jgi:hypothetical protein